MTPGDQRGARSAGRLLVVVTDERGRRVASRGLASWLARVAPAGARGALVTVTLVSDARVRALNRRFLGHDYATDVLSFPASLDPPASRSFLGDIVIARGVARRQAAAVGHDEPTELRVLALHGLLHLLGYDHEHDAGTMARLERKLRKKGGLAEGLLDRTEGNGVRPSDARVGVGPKRRPVRDRPARPGARGSSAGVGPKRRPVGVLPARPGARGSSAGVGPKRRPVGVMPERHGVRASGAGVGPRATK